MSHAACLLAQDHIDAYLGVGQDVVLCFIGLISVVQGGASIIHHVVCLAPVNPVLRAG